MYFLKSGRNPTFVEVAFGMCWKGEEQSSSKPKNCGNGKTFKMEPALLLRVVASCAEPSDCPGPADFLRAFLEHGLQIEINRKLFQICLHAYIGTAFQHPGSIVEFGVDLPAAHHGLTG